MFRSVRGRAVIINNKHFVHAETREGCENDVDDLKKLFDALHFNVILYQDKTAQVRTVFFWQGQHHQGLCYLSPVIDPLRVNSLVRKLVP